MAKVRTPVIWAMCDSLKVVTTSVSTITSSSTMRSGTSVPISCSLKKTVNRFHFPASYPLQPLLCRTSAMLQALNTS